MRSGGRRWRLHRRAHGRPLQFVSIGVLVAAVFVGPSQGVLVVRGDPAFQQTVADALAALEQAIPNPGES